VEFDPAILGTASALPTVPTLARLRPSKNSCGWPDNLYSVTPISTFLKFSCHHSHSSNLPRLSRTKATARGYWEPIIQPTIAIFMTNSNGLWGYSSLEPLVKHSDRIYTPFLHKKVDRLSEAGGLEQIKSWDSTLQSIDALDWLWEFAFLVLMSKLSEGDRIEEDIRLALSEQDHTLLAKVRYHFPWSLKVSQPTRLL
jgi:hypothetical protein